MITNDFWFTYSHTLLYFDSGFTDAKFAEEDCSMVSVYSHGYDILDRLTVARREAKLVTNGFCERWMAAAP